MWINTAKEIQKDFSQRYNRGDVYRLSDLLEVFHYQKEGSLTIDEYYTRLKILGDEIMILRPIPMCKCTPQPPCTFAVMKTVVQNVNDKM